MACQKKIENKKVDSTPQRHNGRQYTTTAKNFVLQIREAETKVKETEMITIKNADQDRVPNEMFCSQNQTLKSGFSFKDLLTPEKGGQI